MKEKKIRIPDPSRPTTLHSVEEVEFGTCIFNTGLRRYGKSHPSCAVIETLSITYAYPLSNSIFA